ncbi:MAG TPA: sugar phosphate isomerase/epimerase, partial [Vicinamibacterales bacterium]
MIRGQILPSTTSHKHEPLVPTLDVFARLGLKDLDLNLNHLVEGRAAAHDVRAALARNGQHVWMVSGGWCDFFDAEPEIERTMDSVERQVALARNFGVDRLRLFFGRLPADDWTPEVRARAASNIARLADRHPHMHFWFENHDGASSRPEICRAILEEVARPNVRLVFDPINFEHRGVRTMDALRELEPHIAHVHLKGRANGSFCGFGEGEVDLTPPLEVLLSGGYDGGFTVEYEGPGDRTLRLYQSVVRARAAVESLMRGR